jgi:hypothetical protein
MPFDDLAADCQAHTVSLVIAAVQALEGLKQLGRQFGVESNAVVLDAQLEDAARAALATPGKTRTQAHYRRLIRAAKLQRIIDQVVKHRVHLAGYGLDGRQKSALYAGLAGANPLVHLANHFRRQLAEIHRPDFASIAGDLGVLE